MKLSLEYSLTGMSSSWESQPLSQEAEEMVIRNTFLNAKNDQIDQMYLDRTQNQLVLQKTGTPRLHWNPELVVQSGQNRRGG